MWPEHWTHHDIIRHGLAEILENQRKEMATLQEVLDAVAKLTADVEAVLSKTSTEPADLDQVKAAVEALDAKVAPPTTPTA